MKEADGMESASTEGVLPGSTHHPVDTLLRELLVQQRSLS
jgi:hypothetical protein